MGLRENLEALQGKRDSEAQRHSEILNNLVSIAETVATNSVPSPTPTLESEPVGTAVSRRLGTPVGGGDTEAAVQKLLKAMGGKVTIKSGRRSTARQAELYAAALKKYGSPEKARKWVAPPGKSKHESGEAFDLGYADESTKAKVHAIAAQYGLYFPLANEDWHIERIGSRKK